MGEYNETLHFVFPGLVHSKKPALWNPPYCQGLPNYNPVEPPPSVGSLFENQNIALFGFWRFEDHGFIYGVSGLIWKSNIALFGHWILPYLKMKYCLIWIMLFFLGSFLYSIYTPYLKLEYCLIWTVMFFLNLFLIVSTRLIWKLNIALFEPWCFFGNNFWKYLHALFETQIWPLFEPQCFFKNNSIFFVNFIFHNFKNKCCLFVISIFLFCDPVYVSNQTIFTFQ